MAKNTFVISHWYNLLEGYQGSSNEFYSSLEKAINSRGLEDIKISRVTHKEGGLFSGKREYFQVRFKEYIFDICAAPYGNGFFFSWWLSSKFGIIQYLEAKTFYKADVALMFQESIRMAILEVIDGITKANGLRSLSELERKPILSEQ